MKKILAIALLVSCSLGLAKAQSIEVYINGHKMATNDTLEINYSDADARSMAKAFTIFKNVGDAERTITVAREDNLAAGEVGWCVFGECKGDKAIEASKALKKGEYWGGAGEYFDYNLLEDSEEASEENYSTYTVSSKENAEEKIVFTIKWAIGKETATDPLTIYIDGEEVKNGVECKIVREKTDMDVELPIWFKNNTEAPITVCGIKKAYFPNEDIFDTWCFFDNCFAEDAFEGKEIEANGLYNEELSHLSFSGMNNYVGKEFYVYYTFYDKDNIFNRVYFPLNIEFVEPEEENPGDEPENPGEPEKPENPGDTIDTGANEAVFANMLKMSVYPNPAVDVLNISMDENPVASVFCLRNIHGVAVKMISIEGLKNISLNVADLASGVYFYTVESRTSVLAKGKIVIR